MALTEPRNSDERRYASALDLARSGDRDAPIQIVDYDPSWPARFNSEVARLAAVVALKLHHIGSTAVPGLAAKPIIDLMAVVDDLDAPISALVERGGYAYPAAYNAALTQRRWLTPTNSSDTSTSATPFGRTRSLRSSMRSSNATPQRDCQTTVRATQPQRLRSSG